MDAREKLDSPENPDCPARTDVTENPEVMDFRDSQEPRENPVAPALTEHQVCQEGLLPEPRESQAGTEVLVWTASLAPKESPVSLDCRDSPARRASPETCLSPDPEASRASPDPRACQDLTEDQVNQETQVCQDSPAPRETVDLMDVPASPEVTDCQDCPGLKVWTDGPAHLGCLVRRVSQACPVSQEASDPRETEVLMDAMEGPDLTVKTATPELRVSRDPAVCVTSLASRLDRRVSEVWTDCRAEPERRETEESTDCQV